MAKKETSSCSCVTELGKIDTAGRLNQQRIHDDEQLWGYIGTNRKDEVAGLATTLGIPQPQLLHVLTPDILSKSDRYRSGWIARHTFDWLIVLLVAACLCLIGFARSRGLPSWRGKHVVARNDLAPFKPIQASDVTIEDGKYERGQFDDASKILGKYPISPISRKTIITSAALSAKAFPRSPANESILRVPIEAGEDATTRDLPAEVALLVSKHEQASGIVISPAYLLAIKRSGDHAVAWVAFDNSRLQELSTALGKSEIFVAWPAR